MYKQMDAPTESQLRTTLGDDYVNEWNQERVTSWLQEQGWGDIAPIFQDHGICGQRFFRLTLAQLVEVLPRRITSYTQRRKLLNDIRALGMAAAPDTLKNISIDTNLHVYTTTTSDSTQSPSLRSTGTPSSAHLPSNSPTTPLGVSRYDTGAKDAHGMAYQQFSDGYSPTSSPSPSPSCSDFDVCSSRRNSQHASPTRTYSPKAAFSKIRNSFFNTSPGATHASSQGHSASSPTLPTANTSTPSVPLISPRKSSMNYDNATFEAETEERIKGSPSRFSSAPERISKLWAAYSHWRAPASHRTSAKSNGPPRSAGTSGSNVSVSPTATEAPVPRGPTKSGMITPASNPRQSTIFKPKSTPSLNALHRVSEHRIQVTSDRETWYSLVVSDLRNADTLKDCILKRMHLPGSREQYAYFHENGNDPDIPLSDQAMMALCLMADHSATQRILVVPHAWLSHPNATENQDAYLADYGDEHHTQAVQDGSASYPVLSPDMEQAPSDTPVSSPYHPDTTRLPPSPHEMPLSGNSTQKSAHQPLHRHINRRLSPVVRNRPVGVQLSDPPTLQDVPEEGCNTKKDKVQEQLADLSLDEPCSVDTPSPQSDPAPTRLSAAGLWAVPPQHGRSSVVSVATEPQVHPTPAPATSDTPRPTAQLWAVPPPVSPNQTPVSPMQNDTPPRGTPRGGKTSPTRQQEQREFWGERPPAEVVCQNMDTYFENHDLDKEIVVDARTQSPPMAATATAPAAPVPPPSLRRVTHTKSIRVVAREASKKYNRARKQNDKGAAILRRKSTKLWDQRVVEVKPGLDYTLVSSANSPSLAMSSSQPGQDKQAVQWIRGQLIGKGSFGRVYLAFNMDTGEVIAVKQVEIPRTPSDRLEQHKHDVVDAMYQEIAMLKDLDHENIVQYLGYGHDEAEGVIHIFLEYVSGGSIASRLMLHGAFQEPVVRHFTRQICLGLAYLHGKGILHRDIKAANILVEGDGVCKISDFGLSKKNEYNVYDQNSHMSLQGSIYWMAPEVVKNEPYSAKVDIWSLGCTVIEMLTGQRPWITLSQIATLYNLGCLNSPAIPNHISEDAKDFLSLCFQTDANKRPTAATLLEHPFCQVDPFFSFKDYVDSGKV